MRRRVITQSQLMEESESRLTAVARDEAGLPQGLVARRILEDPGLFQRWESEYGRIMRALAAETRRPKQVDVLRRACFGLIHRQAMFEYLRARNVIGRDRHAVFSLVFGDRDYVTAVLLEHGNYLRAAASLLCCHHLGTRLLQDRAFGEPLRRYEQLYADYFRGFCDTALAENQHSSADTLRTLLPYLKQQLGALRRAILAITPEPEPAMRSPVSEPAADEPRLYRPSRAA